MILLCDRCSEHIDSDDPFSYIVYTWGLQMNGDVAALHHAHAECIFRDGPEPPTPVASAAPPERPVAPRLRPVKEAEAPERTVDLTPQELSAGDASMYSEEVLEEITGVKSKTGRVR